MAVASPPPTLRIEAGDDTATLESDLRQEGLIFVRTSTNADLSVTVEATTDGFEVRVDESGSLLDSRTIPAEEGRPAALRTAVLLTTRAFQSRVTFDDPVELPPAPANLKIHLTTGVVTTFWARPTNPQLGFSLGAGLDFRAFQIGAAVIWSGALCCERRTSGIRGEAQELAVLLDGAWTFVGWGPVFGRLRVSGGLNAIRADATPRSFAGPAPVQRASGVEGVVRFGGALDVELVRDWVRFGLGLGAWLRLAPLEVMVPPGYEGEGWTTGQIVPWTELRLEVRVW